MMRFYDLPDVLIDYIFSFDDNTYYKQLYRNNMKQILAVHNRIITNMYLSTFHSYYDIYQNHMTKYMFRKSLTMSQYILHGNKQYGVKIVHDSLSPEKIIRTNRLIQCDNS